MAAAAFYSTVVNKFTSKQSVLSLYKRIMRLSLTWVASDPDQTPTERDYIREEARRLFRENKNVTCTTSISEHIREAEARVTMAEHYRNPYPRPVNLPKKSFAKREGRKTGSAIEKLNKMSKPIYTKSLEEQ